jgi:hypothetical protein
MFLADRWLLHHISTVPFASPSPGLFLVSYQEPVDLLPERQGPLLAVVEQALTKGRVGLVFDVGERVMTVDLSVPSFWLDTTSRLEVTAMSIVTASMAVRIAARGFKLAQFARKHPIAVETHLSVDEAVSWMTPLLGPAVARPDPVG